MPLSEYLVSNEYIALQSDLTFKENMVRVIRELRGKSDFKSDDLRDSPLHELVMKRTGMNVEFLTYKDINYNACVSFLPVKLDSVLNGDLPSDILNNPKEYFKDEFYKDLKRDLKKYESSINIKNSTVSGYFSTVEIIVNIEEDFIKKGVFTPGEVVAVILHELGHAFCNYLYAVEFARTNMVLSALNRSDYFDSDARRKIHILDNIEQAADIKIKDKKEIAKLDEPLVYPVVIKNVFERPRSEFKNGMFDARTFEFISDQFATMHGAGTELANALHKFERLNNAFDSINSVPKRIFLMLLSLHNSIQFFFTMVNPERMIKFVGGFILELILKEALDLRDYELYDKPNVRINKIKEQLIGKLKDRNLDSERRKMLIKEAEIVERIVKIVESNIGINERFLNMITIWYRTERKLTKLQHDYETIANNPFFLQSAKIETI